MFEKKYQPLASSYTFTCRILSSIFIGIVLIVLSTGIGMLGLTKYEGMSQIDSFVNSAMIISGVGAITPIVSHSGKLFSGIYSIFAGIIFALVIAIIFAPLIHRFFHKFHLNT